MRQHADMPDPRRLSVCIDGHDAYEAGHDIDTCPYPQGPPFDNRRVSWMTGWLDARTVDHLGHIFRKYDLRHP